jgi:hypothetical protein
LTKKDDLAEKNMPTNPQNVEKIPQHDYKPNREYAGTFLFRIK